MMMKSHTLAHTHDQQHGYLDSSSLAQASVNKPLSDDNRGMKLLLKMGWKKDQPLGKEGNGGIVEPLQLVDASLGYGLGKQEEYDQAADDATRTRKLLDIEVVETEALRRQRQEKATREETLKAEIKEMNKEFYCEICDKQYKTVGEFSNHLSSYDHHHTKRLRETKEANRARSASKAGDQAKKDQLRMEKEMQRRIAAASATSSSSSASVTAPAPTPSPPPPLPSGTMYQQQPHHHHHHHHHHHPHHPGYPQPLPPPPSVGGAAPPPPPPPPPPQAPGPAPASILPTAENRAPVKLSMSFGASKNKKKFR